MNYLVNFNLGPVAKTIPANIITMLAALRLAAGMSSLGAAESPPSAKLRVPRGASSLSSVLQHVFVRRRASQTGRDEVGISNRRIGGRRVTKSETASDEGKENKCAELHVGGLISGIWSLGRKLSKNKLLSGVWSGERVCDGASLDRWILTFLSRRRCPES
jgi:hypothetical protein